MVAAHASASLGIDSGVLIVDKALSNFALAGNLVAPE